jgi:hypothetical protein
MKQTYKTIGVRALVLLVGVLLGVCGTIFFIKNKYHEGAKETHYPYQIVETPTYTNKELGFSITVPSSWKRYAIQEASDGDTTVVTIGLPAVHASTLKALPYPESKAGVFDIARFKVTRENAWKDERGTCDRIKDELCIENDFIASSTLYVFSTYYPKPLLDWTPEDFLHVGESEVGKLHNDFDLKKSLRVFEPER